MWNFFILLVPLLSKNMRISPYPLNTINCVNGFATWQQVGRMTVSSLKFFTLYTTWHVVSRVRPMACCLYCANRGLEWWIYFTDCINELSKCWWCEFNTAFFTKFYITHPNSSPPDDAEEDDLPLDLPVHACLDPFVDP